MTRFSRGVLWGAVATLAMSALMILGLVTGVAPMPGPIPAAIVGKLTGGALPRPALMAAAAVLHLGYGGFWGGVLASVSERVTVWRGLALGIALWLLMQVVVLPYLGWGPFGISQTPKIAVATLVLHLVYGGALGALMQRRETWTRGPEGPPTAA